MKSIPVATYRLQLRREFPFRAARDLVPYLADLGVSHLYLSPCLAARSGSSHGYDIIDHRRLSDELGGEPEFEALCRVAREAGLGLVLDFVPNHMGIDPVANPWWRDVLENGECSPYARFFDIDWQPVKPELRDKVLLPVLGDRYGLVLERGELRLRYGDGALSLAYFEHDLPISPKSSVRVLRLALEDWPPGTDDAAREDLRAILDLLESLPSIEEPEPEKVAARQRGKEAARERLRRLVESAPAVQTRIEAAITIANGKVGEPASFDRLHELLEGQAYRLAYWRTAGHEINYRRFFDVNDLAAIRMEDPAVFTASHELILRLVREGKIAGLRLDHVDGLLDPGEYLAHLARETGGLWTVVEKILGENEHLPEGWAVAGTTGYDFLNDVNGLFVDPASARTLEAIYARFTERTVPFTILVAVCKRLVMQSSLASELTVLAHRLNVISERDRASRDFTLEGLREALREVVAALAIYRTYVSPRGVSAADRAAIGSAIERATERNPSIESSIFEFVREVLLEPRSAPPHPPASPSTSPCWGEVARSAGEGEAPLDERLEFAMRFQQYGSAVQAKGVEDTAFYRRTVLGSLCEVGGEPARYGRSVAAFHAANRERRERTPYGMLASATHDTKRGEDARTRLDVLSEIPAEWGRAVARFARLHEEHRRRLGRELAPDRNDEWLLYQTLIAVVRADRPSLDEPELAPRVSAYLLKAAREAKLRTSWINPNAAYEKVLGDFVATVLRGPTAPRFAKAFRPLLRRVARLGMVSSLGALVLKLVSPGVCDVYQGTELWDLSLVDPDNRRPVDYELRAATLRALAPPSPEAAAELLAAWPDGRIKLHVLARGLDLRRRRAALFLDGDYRAVEVVGDLAAHAAAAARIDGDAVVVGVVPRLCAGLVDAARPLPIGAEVWQRTSLDLPAECRGLELRDELTGTVFVVAADGRLALGELFATLPVALLAGRRTQPS